MRAVIEEHENWERERKKIELIKKDENIGKMNTEKIKDFSDKNSCISLEDVTCSKIVCGLSK